MKKSNYAGFICSRTLKVLLNESFFANVRSLIAYFDCGTFHHFSVGFELLGEGHDG